VENNIEVETLSRWAMSKDNPPPQVDTLKKIYTLLPRGWAKNRPEKARDYQVYTMDTNHTLTNNSYLQTTDKNFILLYLWVYFFV
jgi:hypothetical protein